jgi:PAS domain S-box-containing protein
VNKPGVSEELRIVDDAFFTVDHSWRFTYVSDSAARSWARTPESLVGQVMWTEFPGLEEGPFGPAYRRAMNESVAVAIASRAPENSRWYELRVYPQPGGLWATFRDITEAHAFEAEMVELGARTDRSRRMYETVLSSTPDYNYVLDLSGRFTFANKTLLKLWDRSITDILGKSFRELGYEPAIADRLEREIQQVIATRCPLQNETLYDTPELRAYDYILVPVVDSDGNVEAVAGTTRDISKRKRIEIELTNEARRKDEFLATLAHELRNPLAPIRNALEVSRLSKGNAEVIEKAHAIMERQLGNMVRLIDDLLDLSRISLGKVELRQSPVDLTLVVANAIETARPHIEQAGHDLRLSIPSSVLLVNADATRLSQVFSNLLTNAAKFTPREGHIVLSVSRDGTDAVVSVKDNGVGIEPTMLPRVFEMFAQAPDTVERAQGGLGIGLTLVNGLVRLHSGSVEAHSAGVGLGSEFVVRLPLHAADGDVNVPFVDEARITEVTPQHILIVDDNADSASSLALMLKMLGHQTATANDGIEALSIAESFLPDVCLLDIGMPNLNGYEMAKRMRAEPWGANILLVALTGWGQDEDKRRSANAGIDFHLVKPVSPAALVSLLERHSSRDTE